MKDENIGFRRFQLHVLTQQINKNKSLRRFKIPPFKNITKLQWGKICDMFFSVTDYKSTRIPPRNQPVLTQLAGDGRNGRLKLQDHQFLIMVSGICIAGLNINVQINVYVLQIYTRQVRSRAPGHTVYTYKYVYVCIHIYI